MPNAPQNAAAVEDLSARVAALEARLSPNLVFSGVGGDTPQADPLYPDQNIRHVRFFRVRWPLFVGAGSIDETYFDARLGDPANGPPIESVRPFYYDPNIGEWLSFETFCAEFGLDGNTSAITFGTFLAYLGGGSAIPAATLGGFKFWSAPDAGYLIGLRSCYSTGGSGDPQNAAWGIQVNGNILRRSPMRRKTSAGAEWYRTADGTFYVPVRALDLVSVSMEKFDPAPTGSLNVSKVGVSIYFKMARPRGAEEDLHPAVASS